MHSSVSCHAGAGYGTRGWPAANEISANTYVSFTLAAEEGRVIEFSTLDTLKISIFDGFGALSIQVQFKSGDTFEVLGTTALTTPDFNLLKFAFPASFSTDSLEVRIFGFNNPADYFLFFASVRLTFQINTVVAVQEVGEDPKSIILGPSYPNPLATTTTVPLHLSVSDDVSLIVYDALGREIAKLVDGWLPAGLHRIVWDASSSAGGIYIYRFQTGNQILTGKMIILR